MSHSSVSVSIECLNLLRVLCRTISSTFPSASHLRLKPIESAAYHAQLNFNIVQITMLGISVVPRCIKYSQNDYCTPDLMQHYARHTKDTLGV